MRRRDKKILRKMLKLIAVGITMTEGTTFKEFLYHDISREIGISIVKDLGKLVKNLSCTLKKKNPQIKWIFIEIYGVENDILNMHGIYFTFTNVFPMLKIQIMEILEGLAKWNN